MKQSNVIVLYAALINIMLVASIPHFFSSNYTSATITDERHFSIIEAANKGLPLTPSDLEYEKSQTKLIMAEALEHKLEVFVSSLKSILLISAVSLVTLIFLSYKNHFGSAASFVYFLIPSLLIFIIAPAGSWILFMIVLLNMLAVYTGTHLFRLINQRHAE